MSLPRQHERRHSPNHDVRDAPIDTLILHYTGMVDPEGALERLCNPQAQVSAHWFIDEEGRIVALVDEERRAWHAGISCWQGETNLNARSIGIEVHNPGHDCDYRDFPEPQIAALIGLCREICARHDIPATRVLAHSDIAPGRKIDPGEKFPWKRLAQAGIGLWCEPDAVPAIAVLRPGDAGEAVADLQRALSGFGYCVAVDGDYGEAMRLVIAAFQRHFRPERVDGVADAATQHRLAQLLKQFDGSSSA